MVLVEAQWSLKDQEEPYKRLQEEPYVSSNSPPPPPPRPASGPPLAESAKTLSLWKGDGFSEHLVQLTRFNCAFLLSSGDLALLSPLPAASVQGGLPTWAAWPLRSWPSQRMLPPAGPGLRPGLREAFAILEPCSLGPLPGQAGPGSSRLLRLRNRSKRRSRSRRALEASLERNRPGEGPW